MIARGDSGARVRDFPKSKVGTTGLETAGRDNGHMPNDISYFARTNARDSRRAFGIKQADRLSHMYIIGKTGTGKSTLIETMIRQDIEAGRGCALIDPHGDLVERIAASLPPRRLEGVIYLNVPDPSQPYGYNPLTRVSHELRPLVASGLIDIFKKMWGDSWGPRMEHILRNAILALLDQPYATMPDILSMLTEKAFRQQAIESITNDQVRSFWHEEFRHYSFKVQVDGAAPIQNKVGAFLSDPKLRNILTRRDGNLRLRSIMDEGRVLLVNLSQGKIGADSSALMGGLLMTSLGSAAFSRAFTPEDQRRPFFLYVDEFQNFTTLAIANMLSELRKFGVGAILAHQYLHQLDPDIRPAVVGNAGTLVAFRLGASDARLMAREFEPVASSADLTQLPNHDIYLRLMIDGMPSRPFSATSLKPGSVPRSRR